MNAKFDRIAFITQRFDTPVWCFHQGSPDVAALQRCSSFASGVTSFTKMEEVFLRQVFLRSIDLPQIFTIVANSKNKIFFGQSSRENQRSKLTCNYRFIFVIVSVITDRKTIDFK